MKEKTGIDRQLNNRMLSNRSSELFARLAKIDAGNRINNFRRELLLSLNVLLLAMLAHRTIVELFMGHRLVALIYLATCIALVPSLINIKKNHEIEKAAAFLGCITLVGFCALQYASQGNDLSSYIAAPAFIALTTIFFSGVAIYIAAGFLLLFVCLNLASFYTMDADSIVMSAKSLKEVFAPGAVISLAIVFYTFLKFRNVQEKANDSISEEQQRTEKANEELAQLVVKQQLNTKIQVRLQHVGKMTGWWFDVNTRELAISAKMENGEFSVINTELDEDFQFDDAALAIIKPIKNIEFWKTKINLQLKNAVANIEPWDEEYEDRANAESVKWYRSIGEIESDESGVLYVFGVVHDVTSTKSLTQRLEHQANFDDLTGLHNRRSLDKALERVLESGSSKKCFYLFIDLDRFKIVNDTSGHLAGDELLKVVSGIIQSCLRRSDIAGRIGGDEFGILLRDCDQTSAMAIANRIRLEIEELVFSWESDNHRIGATIGAVQVNQEIDSLDTLQLLADTACLEAKNEGRNRVKLSSAKVQTVEKQRENSRWLQRLQEALKNDGFALCAQAIKPVTQSTTARQAFEVLIRMRSQDHESLIAPGAFLPFAERYGLSTDIDIWVVEKVIEIAVHQKNTQQQSIDSFWINLSGQSVSDERFASHIIVALEKADLPAATINFEITETEVIRDMTRAVELMKKLKEIGCLFALDDFGSGLASFGYLKKLPVDIIKIDGMFIREIHEENLDRVFTKSIIDVAHAIGIQTVAEFVENDTILDAVTELGVDYLQGFGIHKPEEIALNQEQDQKTG